MVSISCADDTGSQLSYDYRANFEIVYLVEDSAVDSWLTSLSNSPASRSVSSSQINTLMNNVQNTVDSQVTCDSTTQNCAASNTANQQSIQSTTSNIVDNLCDPNPCQNKGDCQFPVINSYDGSTRNSYSCTCKPGYTGKNCQTDIDECDSSITSLPGGIGSVCMEDANQGTCKDRVNGFDCECEVSPIAYSGNHCQTDTFCDQANCQNGADCVNGKCDCDSLTNDDYGFEGDYCHIKNYCLGNNNKNLCQNQAKCVSETDLGLISCVCVDGYHGKYCDLIDYCFSENKDCGANGACVNDEINNKAVCDCNTGFTGDNCESVDYCSPAFGVGPCVEGTCTLLNGGYECTCFDDYFGKNCTIPYKNYFCMQDGIDHSFFSSPTNSLCSSKGTASCEGTKKSTTEYGRTCTCLDNYSGEI